MGPRFKLSVLLVLATSSCASTDGASPAVDAAPAELAPLPRLDGAVSAGDAYDAGPPVHGQVGPDGGSASRLYFAVVGDTRPAAVDDIAAYPSEILSLIYGRMDSLSPRPSFAVSTGDYQFSSAHGDAGGAQLDLYLAARSRYRGLLLPAMGNHECTGATASNCGPGSVDGVPGALRAFQEKLLAPIGRASPFYELDVDALDRTWTSKFLVVAANAWSAEQDAWLQAAMSRPTTYTFVVRHEPSYATAAPGVAPSEAIMAAHPYTLAICGHKHSYEHLRAREIVVGNGGAPLTGSKSYGFAMVSQQADGSLAVDMLDYVSGRADPAFHFVVEP